MQIPPRIVSSEMRTSLTTSSAIHQVTPARTNARRPVSTIKSHASPRFTKSTAKPDSTAIAAAMSKVSRRLSLRT